MSITNKLTKTEILEKLQKGEYKIDTYSECDCNVDQIRDGFVEVSGNECWVVATVLLDDEIFMELDYNGDLTIFWEDFCTEKIEEDEIPEEILEELRAVDLDDNPGHDIESMLLQYFKGLDGAKFYRDNLRGFANSYDIYVDEQGNSAEVKEDWDVLTPEEAAKEAAYNGDAATQAYNHIYTL